MKDNVQAIDEMNANEYMKYIFGFKSIRSIPVIHLSITEFLSTIIIKQMDAGSCAKTIGLNGNKIMNK